MSTNGADTERNAEAETPPKVEAPLADAAAPQPATPGPAPEASKTSPDRPGIWDPDTGAPFNAGAKAKAALTPPVPKAPTPPLPETAGHAVKICAAPAPEVLAVGLEEGARMLGICKKTLERLRDTGEIRCLRLGRHWKVRVAELHAFLRRQEAKS